MLRCVFHLYRTLVLLLFLIRLESSIGENISKDDHGSDGSEQGENEDFLSHEILMPGVTPTKDDDYVCYSWKIPDGEFYIVKFEALAEGNTAHHILFFGCPDTVPDTPIFDCSNPCIGSRIMYAWARHAPLLQLPNDVGFYIGNNSGVKYLSIQVHYLSKFTDLSRKDYSGVRLTMTKSRQKYIAGIFLLSSSEFIIPAHTKKSHADISCSVNNETVLYPFAFRTHTHDHGQVVSGYMFNGSWHLLGKGNPHWPQAFWTISEHYSIKTNDTLVVRCTYDSSNSDKPILMGMTHMDEMCNFYLMYYTEFRNGKSFYSCIDGNTTGLVKSIPEDSDVPLPLDPYLDGVGEGEVLKETELVDHWTQRVKAGQMILGQVSGVAVDANGSVFVFHRGQRVWDLSSFDGHGNFLFSKEGPIKEKTVIQINASTYDIISQWADNMFYMPHGLHIDRQGNFWVTDVALHQVMRFGPHWSTSQGASKPDLALGVAFTPGSDDQHFCKPTDVAVLQSGEFFVSDGYCNSRIMKFTKDGKLIKQWGEHSAKVQLDGFPLPSTFDIPHSITVLEKRGLVCVADRENDRVQCFTLDGEFVNQIHPDEFRPKLFAISYCEETGNLYTISGYSQLNDNGTLKGNTINMKNSTLLNSWHPAVGFSSPHDVAVSPDGNFVYVVEIGPNLVWQFKLQMTTSHQSVKKDGAFFHPISNGDGEDGEDEEKEEEDLEKKESYFGATLIIGGLIVLPLVVMIAILVFLRCRRKAKIDPSASRGNNRRFNLGSLLAGSRISEFVGQDDERRMELKHLQSDSEVEEYSSVPQQNA